MEQPSNENVLNIDIHSEVAKGKYSNLAISNYSREEFILDYAMLQPQSQQVDVHSRVIMTPRNLKKLMMLLATQVDEYESKFGKILDDEAGQGFRMSFN